MTGGHQPNRLQRRGRTGPEQTNPTASPTAMRTGRRYLRLRTYAQAQNYSLPLILLKQCSAVANVHRLEVIGRSLARGNPWDRHESSLDGLTPKLSFASVHAVPWRLATTYCNNSTMCIM